MIIYRSLSSSLHCLPSQQTTNNWKCHLRGRELHRSTRPSGGTDKPRKLFADKWDLVLGLSSFNWWVLLVDGAQYHGGFLLYASLVAWITLQGVEAFGHAKVLLNRWQETSEESGTGQQMEKTSCGRPEECNTYISETLPAYDPPLGFNKYNVFSEVSDCALNEKKGKKKYLDT